LEGKEEGWMSNFHPTPPLSIFSPLWEAKKWWDQEENSRTPPFSLPKMSHIFSLPFSIIPIFIPTKLSLCNLIFISFGVFFLFYITKVTENKHSLAAAANQAH